MLKSAMVILAMAGIGIVKCHPHPGVAGLGAGYGAPAIAHGGGGYGAPAVGGGYGAGGSVYQSVGAGGLLRNIGSAIFGSIVHSPGIQVSHGGYSGGGHTNGPLFGKTLGYDSAKGIVGGFNAVNPHKGGGVRVAYGLPVPTGHDNTPWRPIKAAPVDVILSKPAHVVSSNYGAPSSYGAPVSYTEAGPVSYGSTVSYAEDGPASSYGAPLPNQLHGSYSHSQHHMSITPSMSYGYSYKLVPTYAYGPTISGGEGSGLGGYGH